MDVWGKWGSGISRERVGLARVLLIHLTFVLCSQPSFAQVKLPACDPNLPDSSWDNCEGTKVFATGGKYVGGFREGKLDGVGTHTYSNGTRYVGQFRNNNFNGDGTLMSAKGERYVGSFKDGLYDGEGTLMFSDGDKYVGQFSSGSPNGKGTRIFPNKSKYVGDFNNGKSNGLGTLTLLNGAKYVGQFVDDKPTGEGKYLSPKGEILLPDAITEDFLDPRADGDSIKMEKMGGVYGVPIRLNDAITLTGIVDSGAADVSIPADIVLTLIRTGTITAEDFLGRQTYVLADGSKVPSQVFRIKSLKVGNKKIENVVASVASVNASILLGQTFLSRFKRWSVDNERHVLVLK